MKAILAAEHFGLTPAMRSHVDEQIQRLEALLPSDILLRVFLGMCSKNEFTVLLRAHRRGNDFVAKVSGPDLYVLVNQATAVLRQRFQKHKNRSIARRRACEKNYDEQTRSA